MRLTVFEQWLYTGESRRNARLIALTQRQGSIPRYAFIQRVIKIDNSKTFVAVVCVAEK